MLIIGIDGAADSVIKSTLDRLPNIRKMINENSYKKILLREPPLSASIWCSMFSGKTVKEHKHKSYVVNGVPQIRDDIKIDFIWDILAKESIDIKALQIPFVYPPYNFNCDFNPIKNSFFTEISDLEEDFSNLTKKSIQVLKEKPDVFIVVYTMLDRLSHFYWGEPIILEWYEKIDHDIGKLLKYDDKVIIISDHGFCDWDDTESHTLSRKNKSGREIKGDHNKEAILITKNIDYNIEKPQDVFYCIKEELGIH
jgi:predicted AlkP superfamily phosphohydrolase/phosphomutase